MLEPGDPSLQPFDPSRLGPGGIVEPGFASPPVGEEPLFGVRVGFASGRFGPAGGALFDAFASDDFGREPGGAEDFGGAAPFPSKPDEQVDEFGVVPDSPVADLPYGGKILQIPDGHRVEAHAPWHASACGCGRDACHGAWLKSFFRADCPIPSR